MTPGPHFFSRQSVGPFSPPDPLKRKLLSQGGSDCGARERAATRDRALRSTRVRAALAVRRQLVGDEDGGTIVAALPWLAGVDADILAREALRVEVAAGKLPGVSLAISAVQQQRLCRAAAQIERLHGPEVAAAMVITVVQGGWEDDGLVEPKHRATATVPRSLGFFACVLRRLAHQWVRHDRARRKAAAS